MRYALFELTNPQSYYGDEMRGCRGVGTPAVYRSGCGENEHRFCDPFCALTRLGCASGMREGRSLVRRNELLVHAWDGMGWGPPSKLPVETEVPAF